jgi:hypothetical protein
MEPEELKTLKEWYDLCKRLSIVYGQGDNGDVFAYYHTLEQRVLAILSRYQVADKPKKGGRS